MFVTHFAHAFAIVVFAVTVMLAGTVLMLEAGALPNAARQQEEVQALRDRLDGLEPLVGQMTDRLELSVSRFDKIEAATPRR